MNASKINVISVSTLKNYEFLIVKRVNKIIISLDHNKLITAENYWFLELDNYKSQWYLYMINKFKFNIKYVWAATENTTLIKKQNKTNWVVNDFFKEINSNKVVN